ncbi:MAG: DUF1127 domain-containing protein [Hyphomicrobiales bacterium]
MTTKQEFFRSNSKPGRQYQTSGSSYFARLLANFCPYLDHRVAKWRSRRQLEELSDHQLRDIGITYEDALTEARKPFWRD